jgi:hypothetical protein
MQLFRDHLMCGIESGLRERTLFCQAAHDCVCDDDLDA